MISIITVAKNSEATIGATIESILSQNYTDWEHIIIDGASTDSTLAIVNSYADRYRGRLRLVSEPDRGIYDAMNKGIDLAQGDIVGFLNSDDRYASNDILQSVHNCLGDPEIDAIYANIHYVKAGRVVRRYIPRHFHRRRMLAGWMPPHPSFYCRRAMYMRHGKFDTRYRIAADFENLLRLIYIGKIRLRYVNKLFVEMSAGGISNGGIKSHWCIARDHINAYRRHRLWAGMILDHFRYIPKLLGR